LEQKPITNFGKSSGLLVRTLKILQGTHILSILRGRLCDSSVFLCGKCLLCCELQRTVTMPWSLVRSANSHSLELTAKTCTTATRRWLLVRYHSDVPLEIVVLVNGIYLRRVWWSGAGCICCF